MIDSYYEGRGLTPQGVPKPETKTELGLDLFVQAP
jgi:aldehyde:ferredoxin oxidoreductase